MRFVLTLTVLIVLSMLLSRIWVFEYAGLRSYEILQAGIPAVTAKYARIVSITHDDYREVFDELVRLSRVDWERLHQLAVSEGTSIQHLAVTGLSSVFASKGLPGLKS